ncbi:MAG: tRNA (N(6)-L-threonylcarbamoyladenosine(37)-C(2))-methylthiotransferase MtaB [Acholeplasmatales bacterium]|nr:MAG: tRNA (N(6)-L-threonylcarbamoyladenosine(37)-C(2))-methylthiotransferase MtaB [Acholeplasmatales bacterium]
MNVAFQTLGCKVNHYESEALMTLFKDAGFEVVDIRAVADVYVINTCTVTNQSDVKSRKAIRQAVQRNPEAVVAVIGCYSQMDPAAIEAIEGVDIIMGTSQRGRLIDLVFRYLRERRRQTLLDDVLHTDKMDELDVTGYEAMTRAYIKIQDGCNAFCSFCIIPFARGRMRSRPIASILQEAQRLIASGYRELVLTGIHTGGYGEDLQDATLDTLLQRLAQYPDLERLRISSLEINQITDHFIEKLLPKAVFAKHLHIPLQSGSDSVLKRMRRRYTVAEYGKVIAKIRTQFPDLAITTDIITGYPEETDAEFQETVATLKSLGFSELHVFPYSRRHGTPAAKVIGQIHGTIKSLRVNTLLSLNETLARTYRQRFIGKHLDVLIETCGDGRCIGHSSEYIRVVVTTNEALENRRILATLIDDNYPLARARLEKTL